MLIINPIVDYIDTAICFKIYFPQNSCYISDGWIFYALKRCNINENPDIPVPNLVWKICKGVKHPPPIACLKGQWLMEQFLPL